MNEHEHDNTNPLHINTDPELGRIESMLDTLGQQDREAMDEQAHARVLGAVSGVFAPTPISIERAKRQTPTPGRAPMVAPAKYRAAAAALLATAATLGIVALQPWSNPAPVPQPVPTANAAPNAGPNVANTWSLASFEQDLDAYLALEDVGNDQLDEAVADWELWAQTIDTEVDAMFLDPDLLGELNDGAI